MEPIEVVIWGKVLLSLFLALGGLVALVLGAFFFWKGVGRESDGSSIETAGKGITLKVSLKTVGATMAITSIAWAFLGYLAMPTYHRTTRADAQAVGDSLDQKAKADAAAALEAGLETEAAEAAEDFDEGYGE